MGRIRQTFFQRRNADGQQAQENMFSIANHQGNGNQNTIRYHLIFVRRKDESESHLCPTLCDPMDCIVNSPGQNTGVGSHSLLQGIFPTQGLNLGLLHYRQIPYQLSYQGSPFCQNGYHQKVYK